MLLRIWWDWALRLRELSLQFNKSGLYMYECICQNLQYSFLISAHFKICKLYLKTLEDIVGVSCYFLGISRKVPLEEELGWKHTLVSISMLSLEPKPTLLHCAPSVLSSSGLFLGPSPSLFLLNPHIIIKHALISPTHTKENITLPSFPFSH